VRTWRVEAVAVFPVEVETVDEEGNPLVRAQLTSRIPSAPGTFQGHEIRTEPVVLAEFQSGDEPQEPAAIVFHTQAADAPTAISTATPIIEDVIETLSFQMQQFLPVVRAELLDVTAPVSVGEERQAVLFPYPAGPRLPRFQSFLPLGGVRAALIPTLAPLDLSAPRSDAALGWHLKAMTSPFIAEQFMLNWIALEILWRSSGVSVETDYVAACGHTITICPICSEPTTREVRGASIRRYLTDVGGITEEQARQMWRIRQVFHGDVAFDSDEMNALPTVVQVLRMVVVMELKKVMQIDAGSPPFSTAGHTVMAPQVGLGIRREVTPEDL
jgi:hypothetical protein